jgi:antitoxin VapB
MKHIAKIFTNGRSQAVRLPAAFRFDAKEVFIYRDPETGNVILSHKPENSDGLLSLLKNTPVPEDFLSKSERKQKDISRDTFEEWEE